MSDEAMEVVDTTTAPSSSGSIVVAKEKANLPWVEKYRPSTLQDLIAHEDIIQILDQLIVTNKLPHLLFYGPPGTGK